MTSRPCLAGGLAAACLLGGGASAAPAATQSTAQTLNVAAPSGQATVPLPITVNGQVGISSTLSIYAQAGGSGCAAQAADEAARGATLVDKRTETGAFSFSVNFTPPTPGTYFLCTYVDGMSGGTTEHQNQAFAVKVAAAPTPATTPPATTPPAVGPATRCAVPSLKRHTLRGAQHLLAVAHCKLGRVYQPTAATLRAARRRAGGKAPTLVVVSQTPAAGGLRVAGYTVAVRLGPGRAPQSPKH